MSGMVRIAQPSPADVEAVRLLAPLAADLTLRCGPFRVPAAVTASVATLEEQSSDEGTMVRNFLRDDPWSGMGSVHPGGWMLLARDDDVVVVGQREGRVGLGYVVELELHDGVFTAARMGGWQLQPPDTSEQIEACCTARTQGTTVTLDWMNDQALDGAPHRVDPRVEVIEGADEVHFLLHTAARRRSGSGSSWIAGTGRSELTSFELTAPLGSRRLLNDQRIPPVLVSIAAW